MAPTRCRNAAVAFGVRRVSRHDAVRDARWMQIWRRASPGAYVHEHRLSAWSRIARRPFGPGVVAPGARRVAIHAPSPMPLAAISGLRYGPESQHYRRHSSFCDRFNFTQYLRNLLYGSNMLACGICFEVTVDLYRRRIPGKFHLRAMMAKSGLGRSPVRINCISTAQKTRSRTGRAWSLCTQACFDAPCLQTTHHPGRSSRRRHRFPRSRRRTRFRPADGTRAPLRRSRQR